MGTRDPPGHGPVEHGGGYVNFTSEPGQDKVAYPPDTYGRLVAVKDRYDPTNLFRRNQNIRPPATADRQQCRRPCNTCGAERTREPGASNAAHDRLPAQAAACPRDR